MKQNKKERKGEKEEKFFSTQIVDELLVQTKKHDIISVDEKSFQHNISIEKKFIVPETPNNFKSFALINSRYEKKYHFKIEKYSNLNRINQIIENNQYTYYNNSKFNLNQIQERNYNFIMNLLENKNKNFHQQKHPFLYKGIYSATFNLELHNWLKSAPHSLKENNSISTFILPSSEKIHCILHENSFFITGTDIVKLILWYFNSTGCYISNLKKFEEGIFSDLRRLKSPIDASLEKSKSQFLDFLHKKGCIRTQKKQKVFKFYSICTYQLYLDNLHKEIERKNGFFSSFIDPSTRINSSEKIKENKNKEFRKTKIKEITDTSEIIKPKKYDEMTVEGEKDDISNEISKLLKKDAKK